MKAEFFCVMVLLVVGSLMLVTEELSAAPTVTFGFDPSATLKGAVRYRNFSSCTGKEIRIGIPPLDVDANAYIVPADVEWSPGNCVQFSDDGVDTLKTIIAVGTDSCVFTTPLATVTKSSFREWSANYDQH